jgi:hypothetical protein
MSAIERRGASPEPSNQEPEDAERGVAFRLELPVEPRRDELLAGIATLIRRTGYARFVTHPIVLPEGEYFPDPWDRSMASAGALLARLMSYAGLVDVGIRLRGFRNFNPHLGEGALVKGVGSHASAWFAGIRGGVAEFGIDVRNLRDERKLVAALAHEVAHAFRHHHGLVVRRTEIEEQLTDVTAVFLGFGVFVLNASHHVETGGTSEDGQRLLYERTALGYLAPQEFAYLLAAHWAARGADAAERRMIGKALSANQAHLFEIGCKAFGADETAALRRDLRIPAASEWPAPIAKGDFVRADGRAQVELVDARGPSEEPREKGAKVAFRVLGKPAWIPALAGTLAGALLALALGTEGYRWAIWLACGLLAGTFVGVKGRRPTCSDCRAPIGADDECDACGARIVATIKNRSERLAAEERHEGRKRRPKRGDHLRP